MNKNVRKNPKKSGIFFILCGVIIPWFFTDMTGMLVKVIGAFLLYLGMDMLSKDHESFKAGKMPALMVFGSKIMLLISELIFATTNVDLAIIFSMVFMIPDTLGLIIVFMVLANGLMDVEHDYGLDLDAEKIKKNVKQYSVSSVTVLMSTIFATFGMAIFSFVLVVATICAIIFLCMIMSKTLKAGRKYEAWKDANGGKMGPTIEEMAAKARAEAAEANAGNVVDAEYKIAETAGSTGVFMPMPEDMIDESKEEEDSNVKTIYLAGGCFWGAEKYLGLVPGVVDTNVGYANGNTENPSYEDVKYRQSGHAETVRVKYDETKISLERLLEKYFEAIDPVSVNKQGEDEGIQYRTGIYYTDRADLTAINTVYEKIAEANELPLAVEVLPLVHYYEAEDYHQKYLDKNPQGYCHLDGCMFERAKEI